MLAAHGSTLVRGDVAFPIPDSHVPTDDGNGNGNGNRWAATAWGIAAIPSDCSPALPSGSVLMLNVRNGVNQRACARLKLIEQAASV